LIVKKYKHSLIGVAAVSCLLTFARSAEPKRSCQQLDNLIAGSVVINQIY
jgi:hypothetical protein